MKRGVPKVLWIFIESGFVESLLYQKFVTPHLPFYQISDLLNLRFYRIYDLFNFRFIKQAAN